MLFQVFNTIAEHVYSSFTIKNDNGAKVSSWVDNLRKIKKY